MLPTRRPAQRTLRAEQQRSVAPDATSLARSSLAPPPKPRRAGAHYRAHPSPELRRSPRRDLGGERRGRMEAGRECARKSDKSPARDETRRPSPSNAPSADSRPTDRARHRRQDNAPRAAARDRPPGKAQPRPRTRKPLRSAHGAPVVVGEGPWDREICGPLAISFSARNKASHQRSRPRAPTAPPPPTDSTPRHTGATATGRTDARKLLFNRAQRERRRTSC